MSVLQATRVLFNDKLTPRRRSCSASRWAAMKTTQYFGLSLYHTYSYNTGMKDMLVKLIESAEQIGSG